MTTIENRKVLGVDRTTKKSSSKNNEFHENSCSITMIYIGPPMIKSNGSYQFKIHNDEILILQSHTTIGTKSIFKGCLKPNDEFTFKSHRLIGYNFDITIYINGIIDQHIFTCCEYGFVNREHFQTKRTSCQLQSITGGIPCQTCQCHQLMKFLSDDDNNYITVEEQTHINLVQNSLIESKLLLVTTKDDDKHITLLDTSYNKKKESNQVQTLIDNQQLNNVNKEEINQQVNQSIGNIQTLEDITAELEQKDSTHSSKIMNEDIKTKISSAALLSMRQLLGEYLKLLVPQTKSSETEENEKIKSYSQQNNTTESNNTKESDREAKAKMQYTDSMSMSTLPNKAESFVLIWLDQTIKKNYDTVDSEQKLRAIVNSLVTCHTINETRDFIEQVQDQQIYLIVSGELGKQLLSFNQIIDSSKLNSIYIFCRDQFKYAELVQPSNKVRAVFVEIDPLCARLKEDTEQALKNLLPISTTSGASTDEKNQVKFLCSQLHRDLLFTMEYNNNAKLELAEFCSSISKSNPNQLREIEELKTEYHAGKAIRWYTRQTFLFQMLNKALLTKDVFILYKFHFFIKDLHMRLEQLHSLYKPSLESRVFRVYRGLSMPLKDFDRTICAEVKNLIAFDSFLSTSLEIDVARQFALDKRDPKNESILFSIEIDADRMERPFADISRLSYYETEREVLFSIGTVFRIDSVAEKKDSQGIWIVYISTVSEGDEQLQKETQQIQATLLKFFETVLHNHRDANDYRKIPASNANVASMYYKQGEYEESLFFYEKALETLNKLESPDPLTKATYISNVAKTHMALKQDEKALLLYKEALDIRRELCESNDPSLIHTLHTIGDIYREKKRWNEAFEQYKQALELQSGSPESRCLSDPSSVATTYICIGNVFHHQEKYQEALEAFSNALEQHHEHLPEHHPVLAFLYNNIGAMYYKLKQYQLALENQCKCLEIELKVLPQDHKTFAETYKNIATTYEKLRQFDEAIQFAQKCIDQLKLHHSEGSAELTEAINLLKTMQIKRDNRK